MVSFKSTIAPALAALFLAGSASANGGDTNSGANNNGGGDNRQPPSTDNPNGNVVGSAPNDESGEVKKAKEAASVTDKVLLAGSLKWVENARADLQARRAYCLVKLNGDDHKSFRDSHEEKIKKSFEEVDKVIGELKKVKNGTTDSKSQHDKGSEPTDDKKSWIPMVVDASTSIDAARDIIDELCNKARDNVSDDKESKEFELKLQKDKAKCAQNPLADSLLMIDAVITECGATNKDLENIKKAFNEHKKKINELKAKVNNKDEEDNIKTHVNDLVTTVKDASDELKKALDAVVSHRKEKSIEVDENLPSNIIQLYNEVLRASRAFLPGITALLASVALFMIA